MIGVHIVVLKHLSGPEYCILELNGKDEHNTYKSSFSFSLKYLFDYVQEHHRVWFLNKVIEAYLIKEVEKVSGTLPIQFEIKNAIDVLVHCSSIYDSIKDIDSTK